MRPDPLIDLFEVEGTVLPGEPAAFEPSDPGACHLNAVRPWRSGSCDAIGTGYALSRDGLWREHSWGIRKGLPVETTEARAKYFGVVMSGDRATWFADWIDPADQSGPA